MCPNSWLQTWRHIQSHLNKRPAPFQSTQIRQTNTLLQKVLFPFSFFSFWVSYFFYNTNFALEGLKWPQIFLTFLFFEKMINFFLKCATRVLKSRPSNKAILEIILGITWDYQRVKWPKLRRIPKKKIDFLSRDFF